MKPYMLVIALTVPLVGCVLLPDYVPPASGSRVAFVNDSGRDALVVIYSDAAECRGENRLGSAMSSGESKVTTVATDRDVAFMMRTAGNNEICMSTRSFRAEPGKSYEMHFALAGDGCTVTGVEGGRSIALERRRWTMPFDSTGSFCAPLK